MDHYLFDPDFSDEKQLRKWTEETREKYVIEFKKASGGLPGSFWESYSSFCNTSGGWIVFGVTENTPKNEIVGVSKADKIITDLWTDLSNPQKVSYRVIENQDIKTHDFPEGTVIYVYVREASDKMKPVYLKGNVDYSWIRTGDGDRKATKEQIAAMQRNAQPDQDGLVAEKYTLDDLDTDSLIVFREIVSKRYPSKKYLEMTQEEFLTEIGACVRDREDSSLKVRRGTVLFLGKINSIKELYPHYHLDFFNRRGQNDRWTDRVTDDEPGDYEPNIFNFYRLVYAKIEALLQESFRVDGPYQLRMPLSEFGLSIRECLVNCLAHADYMQGYPSTKIDVFDGWFRFVNPGKMLISKQQFLAGGDSRPRNEIVMKLFRLLGASERQGFGGPLIFKTAKRNDFRTPELITDLEHTEISVWNIDLADSYPNLEQDEKDVLRYVVKSKEPCTVKEIYKSLGLTEYRTRKILEKLEGVLIQKVGKGKATRYTRSEGSVEELTAQQIAVDEYRKNLS